MADGQFWLFFFWTAHIALVQISSGVFTLFTALETSSTFFHIIASDSQTAIEY